MKFAHFSIDTRAGDRAVRRALVLSPPLVLLSSLGACASSRPNARGLTIGSATSQNLFLDSSQFANRRVKIRFRNSSGDPSIDMSRMRAAVEQSLRLAGYAIEQTNFGLVIDANLYFMNTVAVGRQQASNEVGALLGAVAGYELAKRPSGVSAASGAIIGTIAGATLQDVLRAHNDYDSQLAICDVNLGVVRQRSTRGDKFVIGGNRFEHDQEKQADTFEAFAQRETIKVYVYAGDAPEHRQQVSNSIQERLARIVSNLI